MRLLWQPQGGRKEIIPASQYISKGIFYKELSVVFSPSEKSEPIVVSGQPGAGDFIFVRRLPGDNIIFGHDYWGIATEETPSIHIIQNKQYKLEVIVDL